VAGKRIEPPLSVPTWNGPKPAAAAAARAAGDVVSVPRVPRRAEEVVVGGDALPELVRGGLPDDQRARLGETLGHRAVHRRNVIAEHAGAVRRAEARRVDQVLHAHRHAVERPAPVAVGDRTLGGARGGAERLHRRERRERVQAPIERRDARKDGIKQLHRRQLPLPQ